MSTVSLQVKTTGKEPVTVMFDQPDSIQEAIERYGEINTLEVIRRFVKQDCGNKIRQRMEKDGFTQQLGQQVADTYVPGRAIATGLDQESVINALALMLKRGDITKEDLAKRIQETHSQ